MSGWNLKKLRLPDEVVRPSDCSASGVALIAPPETERVIGCAMRVHTALGPGLVEKAYAAGLAVEFSAVGLRFTKEVPLSLGYQTARVQRACVADFIVENVVLVELKSVERILPIHVSQVVTYLKLAKLRKGLIINFRVQHLRDGLRSVILPG